MYLWGAFFICVGSHKSYSNAPTFYCSKRVKRIKNDSAKARWGDFDIAANSLLKMVDGHIDFKKPSDRDQTFLLYCPILLPKLIHHHYISIGRHLTQKVSQFLWCDMPWSSFINLGIVSRILGCWCRRILHQQKCPSVGTLLVRTMRSLYYPACKACKKAYHRDVMAGENSAIAAKSQMTNFSRPGYMQAIKYPFKTARTWAIIFAATLTTRKWLDANTLYCFFENG
jgi:hypothetical protein